MLLCGKIIARIDAKLYTDMLICTLFIARYLKLNNGISMKGAISTVITVLFYMCSCVNCKNKIKFRNFQIGFLFNLSEQLHKHDK